MDFPASLHPSPTGSTHRPHQEQKKNVAEEATRRMTASELKHKCAAEGRSFPPRP